MNTPIRTGLLLVTLSLSAYGCARPDQSIAADAQAQLKGAPDLQGATISVVVKKGVVLLRGQVDSASQPEHARAVVARVAGVRKVISQLTLSDNRVRRSVEQALHGDALLAQVPIDVIVTEGVVKLSSTATNAKHRERAVEVARTVPGVVRVEDDMK